MVEEAREAGDIHDQLWPWVLYVTVGLVVYSLCLCLWSRHRLRPRKKGDGLFTLAEWPPDVRFTVSMSIYCLFVVPLALVTVGIVFGTILALIEGWAWREGFEYVMSNMLGLTSPLTDVVPREGIGEVLDIIISVVAYVLSTIILGLAASTSFVLNLIRRTPSTVCASIVLISFVVPVFLITAMVLTGGIVAVIEGWDFRTGFLYMAAIITNLADPLVDDELTTAPGKFFEIIVVSIELSIGGMMIGFVSAHPIVLKVIGLMEGQSAQELANRFEDDVLGEADASETVSSESTSLESDSDAGLA